MHAPHITSFLHVASGTASHVMSDPASGACAIIDPVLDYEAASARIDTRSADALVAHVVAQGLQVQWILETHLHDDHLSGAQTVRMRLGGRIGIGARVAELQLRYGPMFGIESEFASGDGPFDRLFTDGEHIAVGELELVARHTPGHTCTCLTYRAGDVAFVGDTLLPPMQGTARTDVAGGDPRALYRSIGRLLSLPGETRLYHGHDYRTGRSAESGRAASTVAEQRSYNVHLSRAPREADFIRLCTERDRALPPSPLTLAALQVNLRAGHLPPPASDGRRYLTLPIDAF